MPSKRIDELTTRAVANTDLLPPTPSGGPSGSATVAAVVRAGLQQPNSALAGAGADITILAADGVTSGAGGNIVLEPGAQATTGGNGAVIVRQAGGISGSNELSINHDGSNALISNSNTGYVFIDCARSGTLQGLRIRRADITGRYVEINPDASGGPRFNSYADLLLEANAGSNAVRLRGTNVVITDSSNAQDCSINRGSVSVIRISDKSTGGGSLAYTSSTPSAITSSQNNYVLNGSAFQRLNCTSASDITGIAPPSGGSHVDGRMIKVFNVGTANLTLKHNSTSSTAANRMYAASGSDIVLASNDYAECVYDSTDNGSGAAGWRIA